MFNKAVMSKVAASAVAAAAVAIPMAAPLMAANAYDTNKQEFANNLSAPKMNKYLIMKRDANVPNVTFDFTITTTGVEPIPATSTTLAVYKGDDATGWDHWFHRAEEFIRQMNYDGRLGGDVALMKRFPDDSARGEYAKEEIWPAGRIPDMQADQCVPYIEWHMPKVQKAKGIQIIFSGGGYKGSHPDGFEVAPARRYLNEKGVAVVTLKYRTPRPGGGLAKHTSAWQDLQRAIRKVRSEHLALLGATSSRRRTYLPMDEIDALPCKVQWAVAVYPAYSLTDGIDGYNANGGNGDDDRLVADFSFDMDTCPVLFIHGDSDGFSAMASVKAWEQLRRMGVQGEVHTLAARPHCFQASAAPGTGSYTFLDRIWEFMNHKKAVR